MGAAPEASGSVAAALRRAYVLFYRGTGRLNRQAVARHEREGVDAVEITRAYHELEQCIAELGAAIEPALRDQ